MRSAPAVTVGCTGGPVWRCLLCLLPALAATAVVYWAGSHAGLTTAGRWPLASPSLLALLALLAGALAALVSWRALPPRRHMGWDGAQWTCDGEAVKPQVLIDSGPWMLVRLWPHPVAPAAAPTTVGRARRRAWLAVSQQDAGAAWHAWRVAVYGRPAEPSPTGNAQQPL